MPAWNDGDRRLWCKTSWVIGSSFFTLEARELPGQPRQKVIHRVA